MKKKALVAAAFGLAAVLVAGGLVASNMGFKANYLLEAPDGGATSLTGTQSLGLPYYQQTNITNAEQLIADINADGGAGCLAPNPSCVASVTRLLRETDDPQSYTGSAGTNFPITAGEGYIVVVTTDVPYIVVGSHNPGLGLTLKGPDGGITSLTGTQLWSYPYHSTAANAEDLIDEIELFAGGDVVASVTRRLRQDDQPQSYTGSAGTNFPLVPGEAYTIVVTTDVPNWKPSHY